MINNILTRDCPTCGKELKYGTKYSRHNAEKSNTVCRSCSLTKFDKNDLIRNCPKCDNIIIYSRSFEKRVADKSNSFCIKCATKKVQFKKGVGCVIKAEHTIPKYDLEFLFNNSNNSYYFLGLVIADGNFYKNRFEITLKAEDSYILEELSVLTKGSPITSKYVKDKEYKKLMFNNKNSIEKVMNFFGLHYNKTYNPIDFNILKDYKYESLFSMFIGILDGDGGFYINADNKNPRISLTFHKVWGDFYKSLFKHLNIFYTIRIDKNCLVFSISRTKELIKIRELKDSLGLKGIKRKWSKIDKIKIDERIKNSYRV